MCDSVLHMCKWRMCTRPCSCVDVSLCAHCMRVVYVCSSSVERASERERDCPVCLGASELFACTNPTSATTSTTTEEDSTMNSSPCRSPVLSPASQCQPKWSAPRKAASVPHRLRRFVPSLFSPSHLDLVGGVRFVGAGGPTRFELGHKLTSDSGGSTAKLRRCSRPRPAQDHFVLALSSTRRS